MNLARRRLLTLVVGLGAQLTVAFGASATEPLPDLVARAKPSIVIVGSYAETDSPRFGFRGTGFVVGDGNLVVTNMHVVPDPESLAGDTARRIEVMVKRQPGDWSRRAAELVATDRAHDLAILRFEGAGAPPLQLASLDLAREGASIALIGFPLGGALGFSPVTHHGVLSAITGIALATPSAQRLNERAIRQLREGSFDIFQLDATAYPGNSGSPVFDVASGQVLGVVNMVLVKGSKEAALSAPSGISYAIPALYVTRLLQSLSP